jgi:hypothetical protein
MPTKFFSNFFRKIRLFSQLLPQSPAKFVESRFIAPIITRLLSKYLCNFIVFIAGISYVGKLMKQPLDQITGVILTAFGAIAGLSALCYTAIPFYKREGKESPLYAGEKFLHSCILIIQTLFLKFAVNGLLSSDALKNSEWLKYIQGSVEFILAMFGLAAMALAFVGFNDLNNFLWKRYEATRKRKDRTPA